MLINDRLSVLFNSLFEKWILRTVKSEHRMNDFDILLRVKLYVSLCNPKNLSFFHIRVKVFFDFFCEEDFGEGLEKEKKLSNFGNFMKHSNEAHTIYLTHEISSKKLYSFSEKKNKKRTIGLP